jgi:transcriptional regulator with GAF, ATPase, and Fis domain
MKPRAPKTRTGTAEALDLDAERPWRLTVLHSPDASRIGQAETIDRPLVIGREGDEPIGSIDDARLSRRHATIQMKDGLLEVVDKESRNGVYLDGKKILRESVAATRVLRLGDTICLLERARTAATTGGLELPPYLIGRSDVFREACASAHTAATSGLPILLLGETGAGKEVFAQAIHDWSRRSGRIVALNMAALPGELCEAQLFGHTRGSFTGAIRDERGAFDLADGGTLFLDEVGELSPHLQPKLLRVLETREFTPVGATRARKSDVLVVAATNADLPREVEAKAFRRDLFARLAGMVIRIPPLRSRLSDLLPLLRHFLAEGGHEIELSASFIEVALLHPWPMNVRELKTVATRLKLLEVNVLERAHFKKVVDEIAPRDDERTETEEPVDELEAPRKKRPSREALEKTLRQFGGNITKTAIHYGRDAKQIYRWIEVEGIDLESLRAAQHARS